MFWICCCSAASSSASVWLRNGWEEETLVARKTAVWLKSGGSALEVVESEMPPKLTAQVLSART